MILGLDISTTTVGWSLLISEGPKVILGYIPLAHHDGLFQKSLEVQETLCKLSSRDDITHVFIEEDLQRFTKGMSSAATLQKLSRFNGMTSLLVFQTFGMEPQYLNVNNARRSVGCKIDHKDKSKTTKEKVLEWTTTDDMLRDYSWPTRKILQGKRKGSTMMIKECGDMADAFVISKAGLLTLVKGPDHLV